MAKVSKGFLLELKEAVTLEELSQKLSTISSNKVSQSTVIELLLTMIKDQNFTVEGSTLEPIIIGYYNTRFKKKDGRRKND